MNPWLDVYYTHGIGGRQLHQFTINDLRTGATFVIPRLGETVALGDGRYWRVLDVIHSVTVPSVQVALGTIK